MTDFEKTKMARASLAAAHAASALFNPRGCTIRFYIDQTCGRQVDSKTENGFTCGVIGSGAFLSFCVSLSFCVMPGGP